MCCQICEGSSLLQASICKERMKKGKPKFLAALLQVIKSRGWQLILVGSLVRVTMRLQQLHYCWDGWRKDLLPPEMSWGVAQRRCSKHVLSCHLDPLGRAGDAASRLESWNPQEPWTRQQNVAQEDHKKPGLGWLSVLPAVKAWQPVLLSGGKFTSLIRAIQFPLLCSIIGLLE